jgi:hypothetical protein
MSIEAMKQALEALKKDSPWREETITSLRQAIEQAEKQAVFKIYKPTLPRGAIPNVRDAELPWVYDQDPSSGNVASMWVTPVKATPQPQREWVGLTDDERDDIWNRYCDEMGEASINDAPDLARAIEAKLRSKNT